MCNRKLCNKNLCTELVVKNRHYTKTLDKMLAANKNSEPKIATLPQ